jgi:hypothetical protein
MKRLDLLPRFETADSPQPAADFSRRASEIYPLLRRAIVPTTVAHKDAARYRITGFRRPIQRV